MSKPSLLQYGSITFHNHNHLFDVLSHFWWRNPSCAQQLVTKQHVSCNAEAVFMSPVPECPYKFIYGWCLGLNSSNLASKHKCHVFFILTRYSRDELKNADCYDVMSICCPLIFTFSIQTVKYEFDFNFLPGVIVNEVVSPSGDNILVLFLVFLTGKVNSMVLMPIVFVKQCKTPVRTNFFSLIPISNNSLNSFKDSLCGHEASL